MKKIIYSILLFSISISCSDDLLDLQPLDAISESDVFSDEKLLTDYVNASYNGIVYTFHPRYFYDGLSDDFYGRSFTDGHTYNRGEINADNGETVTSSTWSNSYTYIRKINIFFESIESSPIADEIKIRLSGEMKFIRAFIYFQLLRFYGGVPIIEEIYDIDSDFFLTRNTYEEVVQYIVDELDEALQSLPESYDADNTGRATKGAVLALKSRVLLYGASKLNNPSNDLTKWQEAADAAKAVIDMGIYSLHEDYEGTFIDITEETIFERQFTQAKGHTLNFWGNPNGYGGGGATIPTQALVDAYETKDGVPVLLDDGTVNPASGYDPQNPYIDRDPRFYATVLYNGAMWRDREVETFVGGRDTEASDQAPWNATVTGYYTRKWLWEEAPVRETETVTNPYSFFRLAEMYLNYAEALIELGGHDEEARLYINKVRNRAGLPDITETGDELMKRYRNERRVELAMENHRFFDILRWEIAEPLLSKNAMGVRIIKNPGNSLTYEYDRVAQLREWLPKQLRMPIPRSEITKTQGSLEQNPGYN